MAKGVRVEVEGRSKTGDACVGLIDDPVKGMGFVPGATISIKEDGAWEMPFRARTHLWLSL